MMLVIKTQIYENYGDPEHPHWKPKGGFEHKILDVPQNIDYSAVVNKCDVQFDNEFYREDVIDYTLKPDNYLSEYERNQLQLDGTILDPEPQQHYANIQAA